MLETIEKSWKEVSDNRKINVMKITKTVKSIIIYLKYNQQRNVPLTRRLMVKELRISTCAIYNASNILKVEGIIKYEIINKRDYKIGLTPNGENIFQQIAVM